MTAVVTASAFAWLDHREEDAQRVRESLDAFNEKTTVDPLGLGTVRDAFSELLFPGTSTLMTRARYFLFIPWGYQQLEKERVSSRQMSGRGRQVEVELIRALLLGDPDADGVLGRVALDKVKLLPSTAYWSGLGKWGTRVFAGTKREYEQSVDSILRRRGQAERDADGESTGGDLATWHSGLPPVPDGWLESVTFDLTPAEADYLHDQVLTRAPGTALAHFVRLGTDVADTVFAWDAPGVESLPERATVVMRHARLFSEVMLGAQLLYNLMLDELREDDGADIGSPELRREQLEDWSEQLAIIEPALEGWDRDELWAVVRSENRRLASHTRAFADWWIDRVVHDPTPVADDPTCRNQIDARELKLKRGHARLRNRRARENTDGQPGIAQLSYRWSNPVAQLIADITEGRR